MLVSILHCASTGFSRLLLVLKKPALTKQTNKVATLHIGLVDETPLTLVLTAISISDTVNFLVLNFGYLLDAVRRRSKQIAMAVKIRHERYFHFLVSQVSGNFKKTSILKQTLKYLITNKLSKEDKIGE